MLAIRMQRTGRRGHAMFRVVVQEAQRTPTSGKVVARLGSYDPHSKTVKLDKEKAAFYLEHGAQPSERIVRLLKQEGVKLPKWVSEPAEKKRAVRNPDKRRSTRPEEPAAPAEPAAEQPAAEEAQPSTEGSAETPETTDAPAAEEAPAETEDQTEAADQSAEEPAEQPEDTQKNE